MRSLSRSTSTLESLARISSTSFCVFFDGSTPRAGLRPVRSGDAASALQIAAQSVRRLFLLAEEVEGGEEEVLLEEGEVLLLLLPGPFEVLVFRFFRLPPPPPPPPPRPLRLLGCGGGGCGCAAIGSPHSSSGLSHVLCCGFALFIAQVHLSSSLGRAVAEMQRHLPHSSQATHVCWCTSMAGERWCTSMAGEREDLVQL